MKIQLEGKEEKIKQLIKELAPRCKFDGVKLEIVEEIKKEEIKEYNPKVQEVKRGRKANGKK